MEGRTTRRDNGSPRWRYVLLAGLIFVLAAALLAGLWQLPRLFPQLAEAPAVTPPVPLTSTPSPVPQRLAIAALGAEADDSAQTIVLTMTVLAPSDGQIAEALLWYDTAAGHQLRRFAGPVPGKTTLSYQIEAAQEGLTTTQTAGELDYWWWVRGTTGHALRAGGTVTLGPRLEELVATPTPEPPPVDFTWAVSDTPGFRFNYVAGTEAERDLAGIAAMAQSGLARIAPTLHITLDEQLTYYFTPRVFWQGGATYAGKTILLSYLDRNYTTVETWTYFTHEGTHALAQNLIQPKDEGGPDGVLVEGLAVWASGGHYDIEPIDDWAAVIAGSDRYIPLAELRAGPFYDFQHEISYLEAGSFVKFLIERGGLATFKELYGQATGQLEHDEALVQRLYGTTYARLDEEWLAYLDSLEPTDQVADLWWFQVRYYDVMRRYQTELDPDARTLPGIPTEWTSDTIKVSTQRVEAPANLVLETALIAAQDRAAEGDMAGAAALLDDVEAALDAGGEMARPSLRARADIVALLAAQDRAIRQADAAAYRATLDPARAYILAQGLDEFLGRPFTAYKQTIVRLDVAADGQSAKGVVAVHAQVADGTGQTPDDGVLYAVQLVKAGDRWLLARRERTLPQIEMPPSP